jgi:hypothetical protein
MRDLNNYLVEASVNARRMLMMVSPSIVPQTQVFTDSFFECA